MFILRQGSMGFGVEPARLPGEIINRTGSASIIGQPLMCDISNSAYDEDADDGGIFGNGITPVADATWTGNYLLAPFVLAVQAGVTSGNRVLSLVHGFTRTRVNSGAAIAARCAITYSSASTYLIAHTGTRTLAHRHLGFTMANHGGTGTEVLRAFFSGPSNMA